MATVLPPPPPPPQKDLWFEIPTTTLEEQIRQRRQQEKEEGDAGLVEEDSKEFGLTKRNYEFLQYDIQLAIEDFDREHGFDGTGYHDRYGNYVYSIDKVKTLNEKRRKKISAQGVAIAKGLIKIRRPSDNAVEEVDG
jgi:hypothetical protein